jgi:hypothetical protein
LTNLLVSGLHIVHPLCHVGFLILISPFLCKIPSQYIIFRLLYQILDLFQIHLLSWFL